MIEPPGRCAKLPRMSCTVRPVKTSDLDELEDLLGAAGWETSAAQIESGLDTYDVYVALDTKDRIIGMLEGRFDSLYEDDYAPCVLTYPQAWISLMTVDKFSRHKGVGRALLRRFAQDARTVHEREYLSLAVEQGEDDSGRIAFFSRCGFRTITLSLGSIT